MRNRTASDLFLRKRTEKRPPQTGKQLRLKGDALRALVALPKRTRGAISFR
jgi:hypothetical protein